jgi:Ca2+-binding EF-hand superfamily protein
VFDKKGKGFIGLMEFDKFLRQFGVYAKEHEIFLLFNRLDRDYDGNIEFSEFVSLLKPFSKSYQK